MWRLFITLVFWVSQVFGSTVQDITIPIGGYHVITNPGYPEHTEWNGETLEWNFKADGNGRIKVDCEDIRMVQRGPWTEKCSEVFFTVIDGNGERTVCQSSINNYVHKSDASTLKIKAGFQSSSAVMLFKCTVVNMGEPEPVEVVQLIPDGRVKKIIVKGDQETPHPYLDKLWSFHSPEGTRMSFQCYTRIRKREPMCGVEALTFNDGLNDEELCESQDKIWFSKINKAKLRVKMDKWGHTHVECIAQAVTGPHPNEYENTVSEEVDSSEYGVTAGAKKTSCKCGWANKSPARIINGKETAENEFPWMVSLNVGHYIDNTYFSGSCGASIITARHILTAAHCVVAREVAKPENINIVLAEHNRDIHTGKEINLSAERVFLRESYETNLFYEDIAVILTKETIDFSTRIVGPVCLETTPLDLIHKQLNIIGWGITENGSDSPFLRKAKARVMDPILCNGLPWDVCITSSPSGTCNGDSGGPLFLIDKETNRYTQVSLVSRGTAGCRGKDSVTTSVSHFYGWIQDIIKETDPSVSTCHRS